MSYLLGELERRGIRVLAQLESGNSSLVCTPTELLAWDGMNVQRMALIGITKVSRPNGVLEISDDTGVQIRLGFPVDNAALSGFFGQVKVATQAIKAQNTTQAPPASPVPTVVVASAIPSPITNPPSESVQTRVDDTSASIMGRAVTKPVRMSDYADPLQAHVMRPAVPVAPRPQKYADVRGKIYDELGFSFEYASVADRFKAKFIDGILLGIAQRGVEFLMKRPLNEKAKQLEDLERTITGFTKNPLTMPENAETLIRDYIQLGTTLAGEQLRIALLATIVSLLLGWLYYALLESSAKYGTFGKQAARIGVVDYALERISFGQATVRYFASMLPAFVMLFLMMSSIAPIVAQASQLFNGSEGTLMTRMQEGENLVKRMTESFTIMMVFGLITYLVMYCWAFFDKHRQTLYDLGAKTLVIRA